MVDVLEKKINCYENKLVINMSIYFTCYSFFTFSQRGETGDKVFSNRFPPDVLNYFSEASLEIKNTVEHDIIVLIRDQYRKYVRHVYIRNGERFTLKNLPITRIYVQFKSLEFYFEDKKVSVINFGEKNIFTFFL